VYAELEQKPPELSATGQTGHELPVPPAELEAPARHGEAGEDDMGTHSSTTSTKTPVPFSYTNTPV
jgi:hypothetical protein